MTSQDPSQDPGAPDLEALPPAPVLSEPAVEPASPKPEIRPDAPLPPPSKPRNGTGFAGALIGGGVMLALGFGVSHFDLLGLRPAPDDSALRALEAQADKLAQGLSTLTGDTDRRIQTLATQIAETPVGDPAALSDLTDRLAKLEAEMAGLSSLPADGALSPAQLATLSSSVESLRSQIAGLKAGLDDPSVRAIVGEELAAWEKSASDRLRAETTAAEEAAARAAALSELQQAAATGAPYAPALPALGADVPEIVSKYAESGLPPLNTGFAEGARRALETALRLAPGQGIGDRFLSFLKIQTGARSLTPQEGGDPDAILSRAEAAVAQGDAQKALDEVAALPPEAQSELADWQALARDHITFQAALAALSQAANP